jgi:hypothetical protein
MHIGVGVVEVVLVEVEVVGVVVEVLVVVLVVVVVVPQYGLLRQLPLESQGCFLRCRSRSRLLRPRIVRARVQSQLGGVPGTWHTVYPSSSSASALVEGRSAAMALEAKRPSALRRLMEPSASPLASSSKERSLISLAIGSILPK